MSKINYDLLFELAKKQGIRFLKSILVKKQEYLFLMEMVG